MRKLNATQVAALTASLGALANYGTRYGIPLLGFAAVVSADQYSAEELEEVVVTGVRLPPFTVEIYNPGTSGFTDIGGSYSPTAPPIATAPTDASGPAQRNATRCAMRYSIDVGGSFPNLGRGQKPGFMTKFQYGAAWGANNTSITPAVRVTTDFTHPPDAQHTQHLMGYTSFQDHTSYIYVDEVQRYAAVPGNHVSYDENLVNTIVHEWSHAWWSPREESEAGDIGDAAAAQYRADGGASAKCNTAKEHNGSLGGRK